MKTFRYRLFVAALAVMLATALGNAQSAEDAPPPPPGPGFEMGHMIHFWAKKLNLTDDQQTQMKAVLQKERPNLKPLMQQEHQIDTQLRQYVEGTYDAAKVQALAAQKAPIDTQLTVARTRIMNEMYQLLTPDQQAQVKQMEAEHQARMQQHMQQGAATPPEE
ncbi:MAG TPA: Spy/CpxP family protein refolding chaperone [Verrucomicrobiae bacterium]|jgi:periplasmic protein CpxP/Spy|nr:Spy/CpxP family protein refolding chaperone [Verrucomicrobiae bacterium]